jgi:hypothetical protein
MQHKQGRPLRGDALRVGRAAKDGRAATGGPHLSVCKGGATPTALRHYGGALHTPFTRHGSQQRRTIRNRRTIVGRWGAKRKKKKKGQFANLLPFRNHCSQTELDPLHHVSVAPARRSQRLHVGGVQGSLVRTRAQAHLRPLRTPCRVLPLLMTMSILHPSHPMTMSIPKQRTTSTLQCSSSKTSSSQKRSS